MKGAFRLLVGDAEERLRELPDESVQCAVTSPPYWGLRDYGVEGQIGLESTPDEYVVRLVGVFEEVRRVLKPDGTLWLNLGDSYANDGKWGGSTGGKHAGGLHGNTNAGRGKKTTGLPPKNLIGIPWRVAFALQAAGWTLRQDIVGPENELHVSNAMKHAHALVFAWGSVQGPDKPFHEGLMCGLARRNNAMPLCLGTTKTGAPRHPLYVSYETALKPWQPGWR